MSGTENAAPMKTPAPVTAAITRKVAMSPRVARLHTSTGASRNCPTPDPAEATPVASPIRASNHSLMTALAVVSGHVTASPPITAHLATMYRKPRPRPDMAPVRM